MHRAALVFLLAAVGVTPPAEAPRPLVLAETRPLETALGDTTLSTASAQWLDMIHGAASTLDLEEYYLSERSGEALSPVLQALGEAARRGVRVRLLLDAGMHRTYPQPADSLGSLPNISVRTIDYRRLAGGIQHSKFMVADGRDAFVGSQNLDWRSLSHIHELGVRVRIVAVAAALDSLFESDWSRTDTTTSTQHGPWSFTWPIAFDQDGSHGELWLGASPPKTTPPSIPWDRDLLAQRLREARHDILLQTLTYGVSGYGVTDSTLHLALVSAAARGVKVKLLVSDWEIGGSSESALRALAATPNIEVRISRLPEWSGGYISFARVEHCKYLVVDDQWLWIGTSNWEPSYFLTTRNVAILVHHAPLASEGRKIFERDWNAPSALAFGPDTKMTSRAHGEHAPAGTHVY
jgi:phosphatidylserine/phosphatidylglycerophosphate/cardiolipin synthase-like enzyme